MSGIASVLLTIVGIAKKWQQVPRWVFWLAAVACFFLASVSVWTKEHNARLAAEYDLQQATVTNFHWQTMMVSVGASGPNGEDCLIVVGGRIENTGAPSIANIMAPVLVSTSGTQTAGMILPPPPGPLRITSGGPKAPGMMYRAEDFLPRKALEQPIPSRGAAVGYFLILVHGVTREQADAKGTVIRFKIADVTGREYPADFIMGTGQHAEVPDLQELFRESNRPKKQ